MSHGEDLGNPSGTVLSVCIASVGRPSLADLLASLAEQQLPDDVACRVVVVDDSDHQGLSLPPRRTDLQVEVIAGPRLGIPQARNASIDVALSREPDWIAFVDDDEVVPPTWLGDLLEEAKYFSADVVTGPVIHELPRDAPGWARTSTSFATMSLPRGTSLTSCATNNTLARAGLFRQLRFDSRLATAGGSDIELFRRAADSGARIIWTDRVAVREHVDPARLSVKWVLRRRLRVGSVEAQLAIDSARRTERSVAGATVARVCRGFAFGIRGVLRIAHAVITRHSGRCVDGARDLAYGVGSLLGLFGWRLTEYGSRTPRTTPQSPSAPPL